MKKKKINLTNIAIIPLIVVIISIFLTMFSTYLTGSKIIKNKTKEFGLNIAKEVAVAIENNETSLRNIDRAFEDKLIMAGKAVLLNGNKINNTLLKEYAYKLGVFELNLFNKEGKILYSNIDEYVGFIAPENHPIRRFMKSSYSEWVEEDIRKDVSSDRYLRYGYVKNKDGSIIQVGILANEIYEQRRIFSPQILLNHYINDNNILYILIYNKNLDVVSCVGEFQQEKIDDKLYFEEVLSGKTVVNEMIDQEREINIVKILIPIFSEGKISGILSMGLSLKSLIISLYKYFSISLLITLLTSLIILFIVNKKILKPIDVLSEDLSQIDLEGNLEYRVEIFENDDFADLKRVINEMLDKINGYVNNIKEHKEELLASNEELAATVEQLTAAEEELRAQYEEIQSYNERLQELQQKYEIAIEGSNSAVWEIDLEKGTINLSESFLQMMGISLYGENDLSKVFDTVLEEEDKQRLIDSYYRYIHGYSDGIYSQIKMKDSKGRTRWFLISARCIKDIKKRKLYGILTEITRLKEQEEAITFLAYNDHLTGLPNRRMLEKTFKEVVKDGHGAVVLIDLDNFKNINDTKGHVFGDALLKTVSEIFSQMKEENINFFRFGGDEFIILIKDEKDTEKIEGKVKNIIDNLAEKIKDVLKVNITASSGIALYPIDGLSLDDLLMKADVALYGAKSSGKNKYIFFNNEMIDRLKERIEIEEILRDSINNDGFVLYYQPIIDAKSYEVVSFEALLRLRNHNISPAKFIPIAEDTNLIVPIGEWVIKESLMQLKGWKEKGYKLKPIAINVSPSQIKDKSFPKKVEGMLEEFNIEPFYIELEITENIMLENHDDVINTLRQLKDIGVKIVLDDFGTGYSSINYLTYLPVDKVKLDKSLSDRFLTHDALIVKNLISFVKSLNLKVVAEGIETKVQRDLLKEIGCDFIQGYVFSKPVPSEEIESKFLE